MIKASNQIQTELRKCKKDKQRQICIDIKMCLFFKNNIKRNAVYKQKHYIIYFLTTLDICKIGA